MNFTRADASGGHIIQGYETGRLLVSGKSYHSSLVVTPEQIISDWGPDAAEQITTEDFTRLLPLSPELIIYGTGARQLFPTPDIYATVINQGIGLEVMDTGAACRTYNILMSEGRRVAAALILL